MPEGASTENLSLDGQGRVEDHWIQTELAGVTYLDTEPWRGEPLLPYLRKMVFWADVTADRRRHWRCCRCWVRGSADRAVLEALGLHALPTEATAVPVAGGGFLRRMPGARAGQLELDLLVPRAASADWQNRLAQAGVRPAGVWAYEAHRVAALRPRLGVDTDERTIPHEVGWIASGRSTLTKAATGGRRPSLGCTTWANRRGCWRCCTSTARGTARHRRSGAGRRARRRDGSERSSITSTWADRAGAAQARPDGRTALATGAEAEVAAVIDPDSCRPPMGRRGTAGRRTAARTLA